MTDPPFMPRRRHSLDRIDVDVTALPYRPSVEEADRRAVLLAAGNPLRVYLDDERVPRRDGESWIVVRTAYEAVQLLERYEVTELSLDHDLGVDELRGAGIGEDSCAWWARATT